MRSFIADYRIVASETVGNVVNKVIGTKTMRHVLHGSLSIQPDLIDTGFDQVACRQHVGFIGVIKAFLGSAGLEISCH